MNYRLAAAIRDLEREVCASYEQRGQKPVWIVERATELIRAENNRVALESVDDAALLTARRPTITR